MNALALLKMARMSAEECDLCTLADRADREGISVGRLTIGKPIARGGSSKDWTDRLISIIDPSTDRGMRGRMAEYARGIMDGAWELIGLVSEEMGDDRAARMLAEYYLEPTHDWQDVAGRMGKSEQTLRAWRNRACSWLDARYAIDVSDGGAVTVRRTSR